MEVGLAKIELISFVVNLLVILIVSRVKVPDSSPEQFVSGGLYGFMRKGTILFVHIISTIIVITRALVGYPLFILLMEIGKLESIIGFLALVFNSILVVPIVSSLHWLIEELKGENRHAEKIKTSKMVKNAVILLIINMFGLFVYSDYNGDHNWICYKTTRNLDFYYRYNVNFI